MWTIGATSEIQNGEGERKEWCIHGERLYETWTMMHRDVERRDGVTGWRARAGAHLAPPCHIDSWNWSDRLWKAYLNHTLHQSLSDGICLHRGSVSECTFYIPLFPTGFLSLPLPPLSKKGFIGCRIYFVSEMFALSGILRLQIKTYKRKTQQLLAKRTLDEHSSASKVIEYSLSFFQHHNLMGSKGKFNQSN